MRQLTFLGILLLGSVHARGATEITSVEPSLLSTDGGQRVTFIGRGFSSRFVLRLGSVALTDPTFVDETRMTGTTPRMAPGFYDAILSNPFGGDVARLARAVEVAPPPVLASVEPSEIPVEGGIEVRVGGRNFRPATAISFGPAPLLAPRFVSETRIVGTAPALPAGEAPGPRDVYAEDTRGRAVLRAGVTYVAPAPPVPGPQQMEATLAEGTARFSWYNPVPYTEILVKDESGAVIGRLPGDATSLEIDSGLLDEIALDFQGIAAAAPSEPSRATASRGNCDRPAPLTGKIYVGDLEFALYGGPPPQGAKGKIEGGICGKGWSAPQPANSIGYVVPDLLKDSLYPRYEMTTGFVLEKPAAKLQIDGYYQKINGLFGLQLRGRLRKVYPPDEPFIDTFTFPQIRQDEKDWHGVIYKPADDIPIPAGEYLLDVFVVNGDRFLPYYVIADDARDNPLLIPGSPCPPYPMVTVTDMTGIRTLPTITEVEASGAYLFFDNINVKFQAVGTWYDASDQPHSIVPGDPTYIPTPFFEYTWTIHSSENAVEITSGSSSSIWTIVPAWSCYAVDVRVSDTCGLSALYTPPPVAVIPAQLPGSCDNDSTAFMFPIPDPSDVVAVAGLSTDPPPGQGSFSGPRPLRFRFLVVPCSCSSDPFTCPTPQEEELRFRLAVAGGGFPQQVVLTDQNGSHPGMEAHVLPACAEVTKGPAYFEISIEDLHAIPSVLPDKRDGNGDPIPVELVFQGRTNEEPFNVWHDIATIRMFNHPQALENGFWHGTYDEKDDSYHFVVKPGPTSQTQIPVDSSNEIPLPDLPVTIPSYNNGLNSGFVSRFMMQGGLWDPDDGEGSSSGQVLSNAIDGAPVDVTPSKASVHTSGKAGLSDLMEYHWCQRDTILQNQFSQKLFEAILYTGTIGPVPVTVWASVGLGLSYDVQSQVDAFIRPFGALEGQDLVTTDFYLLSYVDIQIPCEIRADILMGIASLAARLIPEADFRLNTRVGTNNLSPSFGLYAKATLSLAFEVEVCVWALVTDICYSPGKMWILDHETLLEEHLGDWVDPPPCSDEGSGKGPQGDLALKDGDPDGPPQGPSIYQTTNAPTTAISPDGSTTIDAWLDENGFGRVFINGVPNELPGGVGVGAYQDPAAVFLSDDVALIAWTRDFTKEESGLTLPIEEPTREQQNLAAACREILVTPVIKQGADWNWIPSAAIRLTDLGEVTPQQRGADGRAAIAADLTTAQAFVAWVRFDTPEFLVEDGVTETYVPVDLEDPVDPSSDIRRAVLEKQWVPNIRPQMEATAIYAQRVNATDRIGDAVELSPPGINIEPAIAVSSDGQYAYCVWIHDSTPGHTDLIHSNIGRNIYYAVYEDGVGWSEAQPAIAQPDDFPGMLEPTIALKAGRNGLLAFTALKKGAPENDTGLGGSGRFVYASRLEDGVFGEPYLIHRECQKRVYGHWVSLGVPLNVLAIDPTHVLKWKNPEWVMTWHGTGALGSKEGSGDVMASVLGDGMDKWTAPTSLTPDNNVHSNVAAAVGGGAIRAVNLNGGPAAMSLGAKRAKDGIGFEVTETPLEPDPAIAELSISQPFAPPGSYLTYYVEVANRGLAGTPLDMSDQSALGIRVTLIDEEGEERTVAAQPVPELAPGDSVRLEVPGEMPHDPVRVRAELDPDPIDRDPANNARETYLGSPRPRDFTCEMVVPNDGAGELAARLSWTNPILYDELILYRDGAMFATLHGHSRSFVDLHAGRRSHTYAIRGRVGASKSSRAFCTYSSENAPPVPVVEIPELGWRCEGVEPGCAADACAGQTITLDGRGSYDPGRGQSIAAWEWDLDGDGAYGDATSPTVPLVLDATGPFEIGLKVTDDFEGAPESAAIRVRIAVGRCGFVRGDVNADGQIDIADPIRILEYQFGGGRLSCMKSADTNDSAQIDLADAIYLLMYEFIRGSPPPLPFLRCGADPTPDRLTCESFPPCGGGR